MDKKKVLLSLAAITASVGGAHALSNTETTPTIDSERVNVTNYKPALKRQFILKVNFDNWEESEGVSHRSHSSHRSHRSHSSHRSSTFI